MLRSFIFLALLLPVSVSAYPVDNDPIVWGNSPSGQSRRNLDSQYLGECVCDVTRGMCDPNCCCDPDCSSDTETFFTGCAPQQYGYPDIEYCYNDNRGTRIVRLNNIHHVYLDKRRQAQAAVCIIRTNHPSNLYRYFEFPTTTRRPTPPISNTIQAAPTLPFLFGSPLPVAKYVNVADNLVFRGIGNVQLPIQLNDGQCSDFVRDVGFLDPLQGVSCTLNGDQICSRFSTARFANLFVYRPVLNQSEVKLIPMTLNIHNETTGELIGSVDASDTAYNGEFFSVVRENACANAITRLSTIITYNVTNESVITHATINVTVTDIPLTSFVALAFQAAFVREGQTLPETVISATPGFVAGGAMRGGTLVASTAGDNTIVERKGGFAIPSGGRSCGLRKFRTVGFMHSVSSSGCSVTVSEEELRNICSRGNSVLVLDAINTTYVDGYPSAIDYVAVTNDALTNDTASWIQIQGIHSLQFQAGSFDEMRRQCSNMVVGLSYQFVIARAGAEYNPQDLILGAFVEPIIGSWRIRNTTDFSGTGTSKQNLLFRVSFSRYDPDSQATIRRRVKAPPILPRLDNSIFYPFRKPYPL